MTDDEARASRQRIVESFPPDWRERHRQDVIATFERNVTADLAGRAKRDDDAYEVTVSVEYGLQLGDGTPEGADEAARKMGRVDNVGD